MFTKTEITMFSSNNQVFKIAGLLTGLLLGLSQWSIAQQSLKPTGEVMPPSPGVAALNKYIDIPVSNYTGTPNIGLPIFTIPMQQFSVPVGLSYHASGLKVSEHASWVGAGWTVSGGGVISRVIHGLPDEFLEAGGRKGFFHSRGEYLAFMTNEGSYNGVEICDDSQPISAGDYHNPDLNNYDLIADGRIDFEPDVFYINTPFGGGKFVFDHQRNIQWLTATDIEIIRNPFQSGSYNHAYPQWEVRLPDGTELTFEQEERQVSNSSCFPFGGMDDTALDNAYTAWRLKKVEKGSEWVNYVYQSESHTYDIRHSQTQQFTVLNLSSTASAGIAAPSSSDCMINTVAEVQRLLYMQSSSGYKIDFEASTADREDLPGSKFLDQVSVTLDGDTLTKMRLNYDYFGNNVKLKLLSVDQLANDGGGDYLCLQAYDYYGEGVLFPEITSRQQDFYGYYNAATGNTYSMLPEWKDANYHFNTNNGVDRSSNLAATQVGTLQSITYPTGGSHTYEYELHDFAQQDYLKSFTYEAQVGSGDIGNELVDYVDFTVDTAGSVSIIWETPVPDGLDAGYSIRRKDASGDYAIDLELNNRPGYMSSITFESEGNTFWSNDAAPIYQETLAFKGNRFDIPAGDYRLKVRSWGSPIHIRLVVDQRVDVAYEPLGGLRIKSSATYDSITGQTLRQVYEYTKETGGEKTSSGKVFTRPDFGGYFTTEYGFSGGGNYNSVAFVPLFVPGSSDWLLFHMGYEMIEVNEDDGYGTACQHDNLAVFFNLTSSPAIPLATSNGSPIGYSEVKVYQMTDASYLGQVSAGGASANSFILDRDKTTGYTRFTYINDLPEQASTFLPKPYESQYHEPNAIFPFRPQEDLSYKNGKLLSQEVYSKAATGFKLQSSTENQYREEEIGTGVEAMIVKRQVITTCYICGFDYRSFYLGMRPYEHKKRWHYLTKTVARQIENESLVNEVEYFYDTVNYSHFMTTGTLTADSEADVTEIVIDRDATYPSLVTQQETFVNDLQVGGEQITYTGFQPGAYAIWNRATGQYTTELTIDYDNKHRTKTVSTNQGSVQSYLWRSEGNRLLATLTNVSEAELDALLALENIDRTWLKDTPITSGFKDKMAQLRGRLRPDQQMTIYYYDEVYGPGTIIDANGTPVKYQYDAYGRLKRIVDQSDHVLEEYNYQYSSQSNQ